AREALERSKENLQLAQQAAGVGVWEWDLQDGTLTWSDEISLLHGLEPGRFDGRYETWLRTIHSDDREAVHKAVTDAILHGEEYEMQYRNVRPDGTIRWMVTRGKVYMAHERPIRMLGIAMDITARKQTEEALRVSDKLAATGRLAATIAHEINNPLAAITNLLYLLENHHGMDNGGLEYVRAASAELRRVTHITRQTLAFYRESAKPVSVDLRALVEEVVSVYSRQIQESHIQMVLD